MSDQITFKDGYQLAKSKFDELWTMIHELRDENDFAFFDLIEKCKNVHHKFIKGLHIDDPREVLRKYGFLDEEEIIPLAIQKIIINTVQGTGLWAQLVHPLQEKEIKPVTVKDEKKKES